MRARVAELGEGVDRDVDTLEVVGEIEGRDEGEDDGSAGDAESLTQPGSIFAGRELLRVDAVRHHDQLRGIVGAGLA